jgi:hypothetical protein
MVMVRLYTLRVFMNQGLPSRHACSPVACARAINFMSRVFAAATASSHLHWIVRA